MKNLRINKKLNLEDKECYSLNSYNFSPFQETKTKSQKYKFCLITFTSLCTIVIFNPNMLPIINY